MRIANQPNNANDTTYEYLVIGTYKEVEAFGSFTQYEADFIEEELNDEYSINIMTSNESSKKEFKQALVAELKAFRKE